MVTPLTYPDAEEERLEAISQLLAGEWKNDQALQDITELASQICQAPMALITIVEKDRQRFRAKVGVELEETPREVAFCHYAIVQPDVFVVADAHADARFARNPLVLGKPHIRFYAGAPLQTSDGHQLGTLCVMDSQPRELTRTQEHALKTLSRHIVTHLELVHINELRRRAEAALLEMNTELEQRVEERTKELEAAQSRLQFAVRSSKIGFYEWDAVSGEIVQTPEWKAQLGFRDDELSSTGHEWRKRIHPDDLGRLVSTMNVYLANPVGEYEGEFRFQHKDGSYRWILSRARMHLSPDGLPALMIGCHIDITDRREMEESLRASHEELRALAGHLHSVREEEAGRMARELHDELGAALTGLKFDVAWLERHTRRLCPGADGEPLQERLQGLNVNLDRTIESVRKVCHVLRPATLDQLGLAVAIEWQANEFSTRTGLPCHVERPETIDLEPARATAVFRVLQELLTNIARHARPTQVRVAVRQEEGKLRMVVSDDGRGLPPDAWTRGDRFGLVGVRERVLAAGGEVHFESQPGQGTRVTVLVNTTAPEVKTS